MSQFEWLAFNDGWENAFNFGGAKPMTPPTVLLVLKWIVFRLSSGIKKLLGDFKHQRT